MKSMKNRKIQGYIYASIMGSLTALSVWPLQITYLLAWYICSGCVSIVIAGLLISKELPETTHVPSSLAVTTTDSAYGQFGEYLSQYEVAAYLGITDEDVVSLIESGELDGVSTKLGANYVFVKSKVDEWMEKRVK